MDAQKTNKLIRLIRPKARELVAMSLFLSKEFAKNHGITPQHIIPIGIDPAEFTQSGQTRDIDIMGAGFFNSFKRYDWFIETVRYLSGRLPHLRVVLCGKGEEKERLVAMIKEYQLENIISLPGVLPHDEVLRLMQRTKVFLHPSSYEGFGAVCIEALYAGAQVISVCNPMEEKINHWHYVKTLDDMTSRALELLKLPDAEYSPVLTWKMEDSGRAMMKLFMQGNDETAIINQNLTFYDEIAEDYDSTMEQQPSNKLVREKVKEKFMSLVRSGSVLDFGGGTGLDLSWLTAAGYKVFFCEPSAMREKALQLNQHTLRNDTIVFLDKAASNFTRWQQEPPFSQQVDAILSNFGALNYIPDLTLLFKNLARVIKPGGHFMALILNLGLKKRWKWHRRNTIYALLSGSTFKMYLPGKQLQHVFVYTPKEIKKASAPWFEYEGCEIFQEEDFVLIHLIRNNNTG
jgi:SAM-dependent methyltransferase